MVFLGIVFKTRLKYSKELFDYNVKMFSSLPMSYSPIAEIHFNEASSWPCFFQVSHHALRHKDNMGGTGY